MIGTQPIGDGGPAFPNASEEPTIENRYGIRARPGMSLRDWFAGQALQSIAGYTIQPDGGTCDETARMAYQLADAMLRERVK